LLSLAKPAGGRVPVRGPLRRGGARFAGGLPAFWAVQVRARQERMPATCCFAFAFAPGLRDCSACTFRGLAMHRFTVAPRAAEPAPAIAGRAALRA